jgi:hypothetical protein
MLRHLITTTYKKTYVGCLVGGWKLEYLSNNSNQSKDKQYVSKYGKGII